MSIQVIERRVGRAKPPKPESVIRTLKFECPRGDLTIRGKNIPALWGPTLASIMVKHFRHRKPRPPRVISPPNSPNTQSGQQSSS